MGWQPTAPLSEVVLVPHPQRRVHPREALRAAARFTGRTWLTSRACGSPVARNVWQHVCGGSPRGRGPPLDHRQHEPPIERPARQPPLRRFHALEEHHPRLPKSAAAARWWAAASCRFPPFSWSLNQPRLPCPSSPAAASPAPRSPTRSRRAITKGTARSPGALALPSSHPLAVDWPRAAGKAFSGRSCRPSEGPESCIIVARDARNRRELWGTTPGATCPTRTAFAA